MIAFSIRLRSAMRTRSRPRASAKAGSPSRPRRLEACRGILRPERGSGTEVRWSPQAAPVAQALQLEQLGDHGVHLGDVGRDPPSGRAVRQERERDLHARERRAQLVAHVEEELVAGPIIAFTRGTIRLKASVRTPNSSRRCGSRASKRPSLSAATPSPSERRGRRRWRSKLGGEHDDHGEQEQREEPPGWGAHVWRN